MKKRCISLHHFKAVLFCSLLTISPLHSIGNLKDLSEYRLIEAGNEAVYQQKFEEAVAPFDELYRREPENSMYAVQLGQIYVRIGRFEEAIAVYKGYLDRFPKNEAVLNALGYAYLFKDDLQESRVTFEKTLGYNAKNVDALAGIGSVYDKEGKTKDAEAYYEKALSIDPANPVAQTFLGNLRIQQKRYNEALAIFKELKNDYPDNPDAQRGFKNALEGKRAQAHEALSGLYEDNADIYVDDDSKAQINLEKQLKEQADRKRLMSFDKWKIIPSNDLSQNEDDTITDQLILLSKVLQDQGRSKEALESALRAYALSPERIDVKVNLGYAYLSDGRLLSAEQLFKSITDTDPSNPDGWTGLGLEAYLIGEEAKADWLLNQALVLDREHVGALRANARLKLAQKKYSEAEKGLKLASLYGKKDASLDKDLKAVKEAPLLDEAKASEANHHDDKEAKAYEQLLEESPANVDYLVRLAEIRERQKRFKEAVALYLQASRLAPEKVEIRIQLGYAYLNLNENRRGEQEFLKVYESNPVNASALTGLGRVQHNLKNYPLAEEYYQEAIRLEPDDPTQLLFLGQLRLDQKRYHEAYDIFSSLHRKDPNNKDYLALMIFSEEQPDVDRALALMKQHQETEALEIMQGLIARNPTEMRYYLIVGNLFVEREEYDFAIDTYMNALSVKPDDKEILKGIGFAYLYKAFKTDDIDGDLEWKGCLPYFGYNPKLNASTAQYYLERALEKDPNDSELYAGVGRALSIHGYWEEAESYYITALSLNPKDNAALAYYGSLLNQERRYFASTEIYGRQLDLHPENRELYRIFMDNYQSTRPSATIGAYYHEEDEWDHLLHQKAARLRQDGGYLDAIFPVNEDFNVAARLVDEYYVLKNQIDNTISYSMNIQRAALGFDYDYNPYIFIFGKFGIAYAFQYKNAVYHADRKWLILPDLGVQLTKWNHRFTAQTYSLADTIEQDFTTNRSSLFSGQGISGEYEYDFGKRRLFGFTASNTWYSDWFHNQAQRGSVWLQLSPPEYWDNVIFRYQFSFGRYNKMTTDYYTYQAQTTHTLGIELRKNWLDDDLTLLAGYQHSWQRSFESGQVLVVTPVSVFHFVHREINYAYTQFGYRFNDTVNFGFTGDYSRDTFAYTMWTIRANLNWSF